MSKNRSLKSQFKYAINDNFSECIDKHSVKLENGRSMTNMIFSYDEKYRLIDTADNLVNFINEKGLNITKIKDINSNVIQDFLNSKTSCTQNSVNTYANSLYKIQNAVNKTYMYCNVDWREKVAVPKVQRKCARDRGANSVMKRADYDKVLDYCKDKTSQSSYAVRLQNEVGIRVEELARLKLRNIKLVDGEITIKGKGGRIITRKLSGDGRDLLKDIMDNHFSKDSLFSIEGKSINKFLRETEDKLSLERHSNHDIRRLIAQEKYDSFRNSGLSQKAAINLTSAWLSHGDNRQDLLERSYVNLW